jgi:hypothetical protein
MEAAGYFQETVTTTGYHAKNMPGGRMANIQTTADITVAFWNPAMNNGLGGYGAAETLEAPGGQFYCPHHRAFIDAVAGDSNVAVTLLTP